MTSTFTVPEALGVRPTQVACGSATSCVALAAPSLDATGDPDRAKTVVAWHWNGHRWTGPDSLGSPITVPVVAKVACPTVTACEAITTAPQADDADDPSDAAAPTTAFRWDGTSWHRGPSLSPGTGPGDFACPSPTICMLTGDSTAWTLGPSGWSAPIRPEGVLFGPVSCTSSTYCYSLGIDQDLVWNGKTWTQAAHRIGEQEAASVSCPRPSWCLAVGPDVLAQAKGGSFFWDGKELSDPMPFAPPAPTSSLSGPTGRVSCPDKGDCLTTDWQGQVFRYAHGHWSRGATVPSLSSADRAGLSVTCPTTTACDALPPNDDVVTLSFTGG